VFALDLLPMDPVPGVTFLQGDFTTEEALEGLLEALGGNPVDLVMSDLAPNMSGMKTVDQPRAMLLVELTLDLARQVLKPGGDVVAKAFQGQGFEALLGDLRTVFRRVYTRKPRASRARSPELYVFGRGFGGV
jgi:23S rRNA (uridine2552-2'-O)-methyltransferase